MKQDQPSWRHLFALLVTVAAACAALAISHAPPQSEPRPQPVMHIRMMMPPPPPPPPPRAPAKVVPPSPSPVPARAPVENAPTPTFLAPPPAPAPVAPPAPAPPPAVTAPVPPAPQNSVSPEALYVARLRAAVEAQKHYPTTKDAMIQQPHGTVSVYLMLDRQGALVEAGIEQSRGRILDQAALQSVHRASYPPFPAELYSGQTQHRFVVSLDYASQ